MVSLFCPHKKNFHLSFSLSSSSIFLFLLVSQMLVFRIFFSPLSLFSLRFFLSFFPSFFHSCHGIHGHKWLWNMCTDFEATECWCKNVPRDFCWTSTSPSLGIETASFNPAVSTSDALLLELSQMRVNCIMFGLDTFLIGTTPSMYGQDLQPPWFCSPRPSPSSPSQSHSPSTLGRMWQRHSPVTHLLLCSILVSPFFHFFHVWEIFPLFVFELRFWRTSVFFQFLCFFFYSSFFSIFCLSFLWIFHFVHFVIQKKKPPRVFHIFNSCIFFSPCQTFLLARFFVVSFSVRFEKTFTFHFFLLFLSFSLSLFTNPLFFVSSFRLHLFFFSLFSFLPSFFISLLSISCFLISFFFSPFFFVSFCHSPHLSLISFVFTSSCQQ